MAKNNIILSYGYYQAEKIHKNCEIDAVLLFAGFIFVFATYLYVVELLLLNPNI